MGLESEKVLHNPHRSRLELVVVAVGGYKHVVAVFGQIFAAFHCLGESYITQTLRAEAAGADQALAHAGVEVELGDITFAEVVGDVQTVGIDRVKRQSTFLVETGNGRERAPGHSLIVVGIFVAAEGAYYGLAVVLEFVRSGGGVLVAFAVDDAQSHCAVESACRDISVELVRHAAYDHGLLAPYFQFKGLLVRSEIRSVDKDLVLVSTRFRGKITDCHWLRGVEWRCCRCILVVVATSHGQRCQNAYTHHTQTFAQCVGKHFKFHGKIICIDWS